MKLATWATFGCVLAAAGLAADVSPGRADEVSERIFEISPIGGAFLPDDNTAYESFSPLAGLRLTLNNSARWGFEGMFALSPGQKQTERQGQLQSYDFQVVYDGAGQVLGFVITDLQTSETEKTSSSQLLMYGGSVFLHLSEERLRPYVSVGAGFLDDLSNTDADPPGMFSDPFFDFGIGVKWYRPNGMGLRLGVNDLVMKKDDLPRDNLRAPLIAAQRDLFDVVSGGPGGTDGIPFQEPYDPIEYRGKRWLNNISLSVAVSFPFGWVWKDADGDDVADRFDRCPTTAPGVVVDSQGCGIDSDGDGVFDGLDQCDDTPLGATVDVVGCPSDTDGDGVLDGIDLMNDTPPGALVDEQGRHFDTDEDGVLDGLDQCNDTPLGAAVDSTGCPDDPVEARLLRGDLIIVQEIEFEPGTAEIEPLSYHYINRIARLIERWTGDETRPLRIELGVHTDGVGSSVTNHELSTRRAEALRIYLLENYLGMGANNLVAKGYGESLPIANDATEEGRAFNRRLEIRSLGPGDPPEEWDYGAGEDEGEGDELLLDEGEFDIDSIGAGIESDLGDTFDLESLFQENAGDTTDLDEGDIEDTTLDDLDLDSLFEDAAPADTAAADTTGAAPER